MKNGKKFLKDHQTLISKNMITEYGMKMRIYFIIMKVMKNHLARNSY